MRLLYCLLLAIIVSATEKRATIFQMCDENVDNKLSFSELKSCLSKGKDVRSVKERIDPETIMKMMDLDNDGELSFAEYMKAVNSVKKGKGTVDVIEKDGTIKTYTSDELFERINDTPNDLRMEGDKLLKETEGKAALDKLEENPKLKNVLNLANWSLSMLRNHNIVSNNTVIRDLHTLPKSADSGVNDTILFSNTFEVCVAISSVRVF